MRSRTIKRVQGRQKQLADLNQLLSGREVPARRKTADHH